MADSLFLNPNSLFLILYSLFFFIIGTAIGSFLNVLIDRLPHDKSIMGRSHCDYCKRKLSAIDLIPVFSYIFLQGKCRTCKKKLSLQYPLIELLTGLVFIGIWNLELGIKNGNYITSNSYSLFLTPYSLFSFGIVSSLIVIFFTDVKYKIIPDQMQILLFLFSIFCLPINPIIIVATSIRSNRITSNINYIFNIPWSGYGVWRCKTCI